jgi:peroxiredoxin (alkyl hydroperoxide reductase subunit C)
MKLNGKIKHKSRIAFKGGAQVVKRYLFGNILATAILGTMLGAAPLAGAEEGHVLRETVVASTPVMTARVGQPAPDFNLEAVVSKESGKEFGQVSLRDFRGKWLVLFFYPADFTFVCPTEIKGFNESIETFKKLNAEVIAISTDSKWSHLAWLKRGDLGDLKYPLLADITKRTAASFNVLDNKTGIAQRGLFIIDPQGMLQYQVIHNLDVGRSVDETVRVLEAMQTGGLCPLGWKPGQKTLPKQ